MVMMKSPGRCLGIEAGAAALASCLLLGLAGCMTTRSDLANSADKLEHDSQLLADDARGGDYPSDYAHDARVLADDAREFRRTAEDRSASQGDVKAEFERLSHSYHLVRDDVQHTDSRAARADLQAVTSAYLDIERDMGGYPEHAERRAGAD
jgi:hypothetical protein